MLADTTPEQFNEWIALYNLEPWGNDEVQAARQLAATMNYGASPANPAANPADLVPTRENMLKAGGDEVDDSQLASMWKAKLGG